MPTPTVKPNRVILRIADIALRYGVTYRTVTDWHATGVIPKGRHLPGKSWPFWYQDEIESNENGNRRLTKRRATVTTPAKPSLPQFSFKF
jgi:hypothetical protein